MEIIGKAERGFPLGMDCPMALDGGRAEDVRGHVVTTLLVPALAGKFKHIYFGQPARRRLDLEPE